MAAVTAPSSSVVDPASSAAPPEPPYDLAADLVARTALAKTYLGDDAPVSVANDVFLITTAGSSRTLGSSVDLTKNALDAYFNGRFDARPARAVTVLLFPTAQGYEAYCQARYSAACISPFGFYMPMTREIIMNAGPGLGTLTHELVHPIIEADFPTAPIWINEGIAALFEQPIMPGAGEIHGGKNWRLPRLLTGLVTPGEKDGVNLPALFAMSDDAFRAGEERLHYAMARYFCQWLDSQDKLWPFYRTWRDHAAEDPTGEKSFATVVGHSPAEVNEAWTTWVRLL